MAINVIGTLKPKNNGSFPVAEAADIAVTADKKLNTVLEESKFYTTPKMYGAVGDGITDDTDAFEAALADSKVLFVPSGHYIVSRTLQIPAGGTVIGESRNSVTIESSAVTAFQLLGTGNFFEKIKILGKDNNICIAGSGYDLHLNNCELSNFNVGIACTKGFMLSSITETNFVYINDCITVKAISTASSFKNVWFGFGNNFIVLLDAAIITFEGFSFENCTFEGINNNEKKIEIIKSSADHQAALRAIKFQSCYFEGNGEIFTDVFGCVCEFDSCWFYYTDDYTENQNYFNVINHVPTYMSTITIRNCSMGRNLNKNNILIGNSTDVIYYVEHVSVGSQPFNQENYELADVRTEDSYFFTLFEQTETIEKNNGYVEFDCSQLSDGTPHTYIISMSGTSNTDYWKCLYYFSCGLNQSSLVPIIVDTDWCELVIAEQGYLLKFINKSPTYDISLDFPIKIQATRIC